MNLRVLAVGRETELQLLAREVAGEIFAADNLAEAFDIVERSNPDLILFDYLFGSVGLNRFVNAINKNSNACVIVVGEDKNRKVRSVPIDTTMDVNSQREKIEIYTGFTSWLSA